MKTSPCTSASSGPARSASGPACASRSTDSTESGESSVQRSCKGGRERVRACAAVAAASLSSTPPPHLEQRGAEAQHELGSCKERRSLGGLDANLLGVRHCCLEPRRADARQVERTDDATRARRRQRARELRDEHPVVDLVLHSSRLGDGHRREQLPLHRLERDGRLPQVLVEEARAKARDDLARKEHLLRLGRLGPKACSQVERGLEWARVHCADVQAARAALRPAALQRRGDLEEDGAVVELVLCEPQLWGPYVSDDAPRRVAQRSLQPVPVAAQQSRAHAPDDLREVGSGRAGAPRYRA